MSVGLTPMSLTPADDRAGGRAGLLAIDKPAGVTSHDVVGAVRRRLRVKRAGHLGTLDPAATGLLLVATGPATRAVTAWQGGEKTYEATIRFGIVTSTQDTHGEVLERSDRVPAESEARAAALALTGEIEQVPPMVSALKVGGKRLYALARQGIEVEREPRRITVRSWDWLSFGGATARFAWSARGARTCARWRTISAAPWAAARRSNSCAGCAASRSGSSARSRCTSS